MVLSQSMNALVSKKQADNLFVSVQGLASSLLRRIGTTRWAPAQTVYIRDILSTLYRSSSEGDAQPALRTMVYLHLVVSGFSNPGPWSGLLLENIVSIIGTLAIDAKTGERTANAAEVSPLATV